MPKADFSKIIGGTKKKPAKTKKENATPSKPKEKKLEKEIKEFHEKPKQERERQVRDLIFLK